MGRPSCEGPQDDCACELRKILWLDTLPMDRINKLASAVIARHKNPAHTISLPHEVLTMTQSNDMASLKEGTPVTNVWMVMRSLT